MDPNKELMRVPFLVPDVGAEECAEVTAAMLSGWITTGPRVQAFEEALAAYIGTERVACLSSQTACAELTLRLLGVGPGDEVITCAYTYTATAEVIAHVGAKIVLVDTAPGSFEMDLDALEAAVTERTKVIIPVDVGGVPCDLAPYFAIAQRKRALFRPANGIQRAFGRIIILADAAHSLGAERNGLKEGNYADFSAFSMHAVKNLTTAEGGAVTWRAHEELDTEAVSRFFRVMSLHGQNKDALLKYGSASWEYDVVDLGYKCNMTDLAAAIGLVQLRRYDTLLKRRSEIICRYDAALQPAGLMTLAHSGPGWTSSGHLYLVRVPGIGERERNALIRKMDERGISCNVHYKPLPMLTAYRALGFDIADYPNAFGMYENEITLPLYSRLSDKQVGYVIETFLALLKECL